MHRERAQCCRQEGSPYPRGQQRDRENSQGWYRACAREGGARSVGKRSERDWEVGVMGLDACSER